MVDDPYDELNSQWELRYNRAHRVTRSAVELAIGLWKLQFRSIRDNGDIFSYSPQKVNVKY
jgi:hypothetical protein